jgi:hypothetical protein
VTTYAFETIPLGAEMYGETAFEGPWGETEFGEQEAFGEQEGEYERGGVGSRMPPRPRPPPRSASSRPPIRLGRAASPKPGSRSKAGLKQPPRGAVPIRPPPPKVRTGAPPRLATPTRPGVPGPRPPARPGFGASPRPPFGPGAGPRPPWVRGRRPPSRGGPGPWPTYPIDDPDLTPVPFGGPSDDGMPLDGATSFGAPSGDGMPPVPAGEHTRWVQSCLGRITGARLPITGVMDAATRSAVRSFQQSQGLPADGIVGPPTQSALAAACAAGAAPAAAAPAASPEEEPAAAPDGPAAEPASGAADAAAEPQSEFGFERKSCRCPSCRAQRQAEELGWREIAQEVQPEAFEGEFAQETFEYPFGEAEFPATSELFGKAESEREFGAGELFGETEGETSFGEAEAEFEMLEFEHGGIASGSKIITKVPLLQAHRGVGPDLVMSWNAMNYRPEKVDVVVHLHGFAPAAGKPLDIARDVKPRSGLDWSQPKGSGAPGRTRPTLALLPRGHFVQENGRAYAFPALSTRTGLKQLVRFGLDQLAAALGGPSLAAGRLILTAHSGGGAALLRVLQYADPDEIHIFDGLYNDPGALIRWTASRIARDRNGLAATNAPKQYMAERGGALRVLYGAGTARYSKAVAEALRKAIPSGSPLQRYYRVEPTRVPHLQIPPVYGWRLLADGAADIGAAPAGGPSPSLLTAGAVSPASGAALRGRIVAIATREWERWGRGELTEREPAAVALQREYYRIGVKQNVTADQLQNKFWQKAHPWSAVFISYVMRTAGAGDAFPYHPLHTFYVCEAQRARARGDRGKFWTYRTNEATPEVGDLVCRDRPPEDDSPCAETTYDTVCEKGKISHCEVVIAIDRTKNQMRVIGGNNANNSVGNHWVPLGAGGLLPTHVTKGCQWIGVLKPPPHSA